jgi:hypothetical protein
MPRYHIELITFNLLIELHRRLAGHQPLAQWAGHVLNITRIQSQLLGDLTVGEVEPHEIQAQYPNTQGLMRPFEDRTRQVIEIPLAASTMLLLTWRLGFIPAVFDHRSRLTVRTPHTVRPA